MIFIGYTDPEKRAEIERYRAEHAIGKTVVISADDFSLPIPGTDQIQYSQVIKYVTFYRLLQEIDGHALVVVNECLRTQNRYDLAYNCIRNFLNQTSHQLVFQLLPQIDAADDFMVLFDFDSRSRWKRRPFDPDLIRRESQVLIRRLPLAFSAVDVPTSEQTKERYTRERERWFRELGKRDPHIIPRNLYLLGGQDKKAFIQQGLALPLFSASRPRYVARNRRLGLECVVSYESVEPQTAYTVVELPHRFIDFVDYITRTGQATSEVLVADLNVDRWYFDRYADWSRRIHETYASLS